MSYVRILAVCLAVLPQMAFSATSEELDQLYRALLAPDLMEILNEEGRVQSQELQDEMFPGRSTAAWQATTSGIYGTDTMTQVFRDRFDTELAETDIVPLLTFLESGQGVRIMQLEVDARRALMDDSVDEAAREAFDALQEDDPARVVRLTEFVEANNLIDLNVSGALNANLAFYNGLAAGGGFDLPQDEILADVWESADEIREDTTEWIYGYVTLAYGPLEDAAIDAYIELSETPAGKALNRALFAAFDDLFRGISFDLGKAASKFAQGDDI